MISGRRRPEMRQQLVDAAVRLRWQSGQHILEVSPGIVPVQLRRPHEAHDDGGALAGQFTAGEEPRLALMHIYA